GGVGGVGHRVEVAVLDAALQPGRVDVDHQAHAAVERDGERLGPAHTAAAAGDGERAGEGAAEPLVGDRGERLVGALEDALGADVDPRARGHLAVHDQAELLQPPELRPVRPVADQVGVGDEHPRRPLVGAQHPDRTAGLHEHRLVVGQCGERADHRVERRPVAGRPPRPAVDDQGVGPLRDLRVEVVAEHPQRGLGLPGPGRERRAARRADGPSTLHDELLPGQRSVDQRRGPMTLSAAASTSPEVTNCTAASISGARWRSGPGPATSARSRSRTAAVAGAGASGARRSRALAAVSTSIAMTRARPSTARRSFRAADQPMATWSSCIALDGIESTEAGTASRLSSDTIPACVYCAIMCPESTPGSSARNAGRPWLRATSRNGSVRSSLIDAPSATGIATKSSTYPMGAPWKFPVLSTRPSTVTTGLSTAAASSRPATASAWASVSRAAPCTCGAQRSE